MAKEVVRIQCDYGSLGDQLCFIGAARNYAKVHRDRTIKIPNFPDLIRSYEDDLLSTSEGWGGIPCNPELRHRVKHRSPDWNYLGTYMAELGMSMESAPSLELPPVPPLSGLAPRTYVCIQPYSGFCGVPDNPEVFFPAILDALRGQHEDLSVVAVGLPNTPQEIGGVSYDHLGDHVTMLRCIRHAALVLTARSASAHIASAYQVPALVWMPDDGEAWHLDYPQWPHVRIGMRDDVTDTCDRLLALGCDVRRGEPKALQKYCRSM